MASFTHSDIRLDKAPAMGVFFSPPEGPKADTFAQSQSPLRQARTVEQARNTTKKSISIDSLLVTQLSPPISPATRVEEESGVRGDNVGDENDPQLFPDRAACSTYTSQPLFRPGDTFGPPTIEEHLQSQRDAPTAAAKSRAGKWHEAWRPTLPKPAHDEPTLAITCRQRVMDRFRADPHRYITQELKYLEAYPPRWPANNTSDRLLKRKADPTGLTDRAVKRTRPAPKHTNEKTPAVKRVPRASPKEAPVGIHQDEQPQKHKRKASRADPVPRDDMDYHQVPDYSPPIATITSGKNLKIDWKGHPLDLSDDPDRHMLDVQEVHLASTLRLSGAQYLFAKRKIFERFIELARVGKDFNKTSAQAVCKIDVNKASKLWTAFEKVGWFDKRHFVEQLR